MAPYNKVFNSQILLANLCLGPFQRVAKKFDLDTNLISRIIEPMIRSCHVNAGPSDEQLKCTVRAICEFHFVLQIYSTFDALQAYEFNDFNFLTKVNYKLKRDTLELFQQFGNFSADRVRIEVNNFETLLYTAIANAEIYLANVSKFDEDDRSTYYEEIVPSLPIIAVKSKNGLEKFKQLVKEKVAELSEEKTIIDNKYYSPIKMDYGDDLTAAIASIPNEYVHSAALKAYYNLINLPPKVEITDDTKHIIEKACNFMGYIPSYDKPEKLRDDAREIFLEAFDLYRLDVQYAPEHVKMVNRSFTKEGSPLQFDLMREEKIIFDFSLGLFP
ncbi:hypothetical protein DAPK24_049230 [Pichia kluyveri]|uniref:Uncharacterized protein n=1 Tax=Pichia kluyveri TaxID=36015 RepID=A0AAV5R9Y2_PICKL|nr:hypothetical protein DAPK24_049230 [Pichia kluyveri]